MDHSEYLKAPFWESEDLAFFERNDLEIGGGLALPSGAVLFRSSGSSGVEKWIVHTRKALLVSAKGVNEFLSVSSEDVFGLLLPVHHVGGFGVLARAYVAGVRCAVYSVKWCPDQAAKFLVEQGVTVTSMVPTQVYDLVANGVSAPECLRVIIVGGGHLDDELGQQARALGWPVLQSYGMSEAGSQIATASLESLNVAYSSHHLEVLPIWQVDIDGNQRLTIAGKALASGILTNAEGWQYSPIGQAFTTNDRVKLCDSKLSFLGRTDRTVKIKGELVDLDPLEKKIQEATAVEVVLVPVVDDRDGLSLVSFSEADIKDEILELLPSYVRLKEAKVVKSFPRSALGKIDRRLLNQEL